MNVKILVAGAVMVGATFASSAEAQEAASGPAPSTATTAINAKVEDDAPDHERFIHHFAVGYFGISQIPIGTPASVTESTVTAPIIGARYWLQRNLGIDAGIGLGYSGGSTTVTTVNNNVTTTTKLDNPSQFGFALHGGVPIAFAEGHHYTFELVPEATVGFASGSVKGVNGGPDTNLSGIRLDVGAHVGAEIHFGFIGVPELALEASVGLYVRHQGWKESVANNGGSQSGAATSFATSVGSDPWAIFANNISALYYF